MAQTSTSAVPEHCKGDSNNIHREYDVLRSCSTSTISACAASNQYQHLRPKLQALPDQMLLKGQRCLDNHQSESEEISEQLVSYLHANLEETYGITPEVTILIKNPWCSTVSSSRITIPDVQARYLAATTKLLLNELSIIKFSLEPIAPGCPFFTLSRYARDSN